MLKLKPAGKNRLVMEVPGGEVLLSYATPVAAVINGEAFVTDVFHSGTTLRHIDEWLDQKGMDFETEQPQKWFDELALKEPSNV